jgi:DNA-binding MarR family transcriptional regulator
VPNDETRRAARAIALAARTLERAAGDLSLAQFRVLAVVAGGDERSSLIAERLAVAKPTVTAVVDGLCERGYLAREAVAGDRRSQRLVVTARGRAALAAAHDAMADALERVLAGRDGRDAVLTSLARLDDALTAYFTERLAR